jgi:hypothetical protein
MERPEALRNFNDNLSRYAAKAVGHFHSFCVSWKPNNTIINPVT